MKEGYQISRGFDGRHTEHPETTIPVDVERMGEVMEAPELYDGNGKRRFVRVPDNIPLYLGSESNEKERFKHERLVRQGAFPSEEGFGRGFHDVELSTDFWAPYKRVEDRDKSELTAHREYAYVMTPDGRLHSNRVVVEGVGGHSLADYKRKYFDVRKIVESREITPEGRVASNRRIVEYMAELNEEDSLRHHRAMGEEIGLTRDYMVSKEESRPRRGTEEEIENLTYNQYGWIQKREHRRLKNGDIVDEWTVTRVGGINFLVERPEKFRDPFPWGRKQQPEYLGHRSGAAEERYNNPFYAFGDLMES